MASSTSASPQSAEAGVFQEFGRSRHAPRADAARRSLQSMGRRGRKGGFRACNPVEHDAGLTDEKFEDFALQPAIAKRHALEMAAIDGF